MMFSLTGHAALITGSTKGVGRAIAEAYAAAGADVLIHGRTRGPEADEAVAACRAKGVRAEFLAGDLSQPEADALHALSPRVRDDIASRAPESWLFGENGSRR